MNPKDHPGPGERVEGRAFEAVAWDEADLTQTAFDRCAFSDSAFGNANLSGARFSRCRLLRAAFAHADLREAVFADCVFADPETQQGGDFAFCRLDEARFPQARFHRAFGRKVVRAAVDFLKCNLELADLADANLAACDLSGSRLREADIGGADLEGANLRDTDLFQARIDGARLAGADLRGGEVSGLDLRRLASYEGLKITADQQFRLLDALGLDIHFA